MLDVWVAVNSEASYLFQLQLLERFVVELFPVVLLKIVQCFLIEYVSFIHF